MKLGIIMDSILSINIYKDSSFAILLEAQYREYKIYYMEENDLYFDSGHAFAKTKHLKVKKNEKKWFHFIKEENILLSTLDVILMRKDPPVNSKFLYISYLLEYAEKTGTLIVNKPKSLRNYNEKIFATLFTEFNPPTLITNNILRIKKFWKKHEDIILKPLNSMGGRSVFRIKNFDCNSSAIIENITNYGKRYCMSQKYIPEIKNGDKRLLMINGTVIPYCLARIPKLGETRANLAAGGHGEVRALSESDLYIAKTVGPILKNEGLIFVGLDIIGDKLTEINITSPTCIQEIEKCIPQFSITGLLMDTIENLIQL